ncbi:hypothetical protein TWF730_006277 [Orbilia blumenaviensis]|uniref:Uncharacterized protein n=1 Tax=Orbilia blumenaviensis TaxID=1796055 RepID=A0AAV9VG46_9PEZI
MDHRQRDTSVNMTLVGLALKAQRNGQPFSSAAAETLQKNFPSIPPDVLVERVAVLQEARDQLVVTKYGSVITMKSTSGRSPKESPSKNANGTVASEETTNGVDASRWSPSRPSPQRQIKHTPIHLPDFDALVITDSECDETLIIHNPRRARSPTKSRSHETEPSQANPRFHSPEFDGRADTTISSSPKAPNKLLTPQSSSPVKKQINLGTSGFVGSLTSPTRYSREGDHRKSPTKSPECSPIKRMLNNKASRLRAQSNIQKITGFESPKHSRLNFEKRSPAKTPSPSRLHNNAVDADVLFATIDDYFQSSPQKMKPDKVQDENKRKYKPDTPKTSPLKVAKRPPLNRYFTNESTDLGPSPSSLVFQMDEDIDIQNDVEPPKYVENEAYDFASVNGNIQINVQGEATKGCTGPQSPFESPEPCADQKLKVQDHEISPTIKPGTSIKSTSRKISVQGIMKAERVNTEVEFIEPEDPSEPTILNIKVGSRGLIINVDCAGDLIMGETSFN